MLRTAEQKVEGDRVSDGLTEQLNIIRKCQSLNFLLQDKNNPLEGTTDCVAETTEIYFPIILEARSPRSGVGKAGFL